MRIITIGLAMVMIGSQWQAAAAESTEQQQYTVRQSEPSVGSTLRRDIIKAGTVPLDKRYSELTTEQKNVVKSAYESMKDTDEPPFPANGLMPILKSLRAAHEQFGLKYKGELTMYVQVDSQGKATGVSVVKSPDPEITKVMAYALMTQPYKPAVCNGTPCAMQYPFNAELIGPNEKDIQSLNPSGGIQVTPG